MDKMEKFIIHGGKTLTGTVHIGGAKNVVLKLLVAACLTEEDVVIQNVPQISDVRIMIEIMRDLGAEVTVDSSTVTVRMKEFKKKEISLEQAAHVRTSSMFIAPLLARAHEAKIPNPGGCRLGARPINRTVDGLEEMGAAIEYNSEDGYFHATVDRLQGFEYTFEKNTHTGTETMIIASVLAKGKTILRNAALEPEIDELIAMLTSMGAQVKRTEDRVIEIMGVDTLHGTTARVNPDRNEIVTFAIAALVTKGDLFIKEAKRENLEAFLQKLTEVGAGVEVKEDGIRFYYKGELIATDVTTNPHPAFMTDWQAPWAVLMTQAKGTSIIHETVFENKLGYVHELRKMGAKIEFFNPPVENKAEFYNFNLDDDLPEYFHAIKVKGPTTLHDAIVKMIDLRAGAAVVLAALAAKGATTLHGVHLVDRGYEQFEDRLRALGAHIERSSDE